MMKLRSLIDSLNGNNIMDVANVLAPSQEIGQVVV